jgi:ribonuclease D
MISTNDELRELIKYLLKEEFIAIDTEFIWRNTYFPKLCLIQIGTKNSTFLIDTLTEIDLTLLKPVLESKSIIKIFHAASHDIKILAHESKANTAPIVDTQLAAEFLGIIHQGSLKYILNHYQIASINKEEKLSDWSQRPLSISQKNYATNDVLYLIPCYKKMLIELHKSKRLEWFHEECQFLMTIKSYQYNNPSIAYKKIKNYKKLTPIEQYKLRELAHWRELISIQKNKIPRRLLSDELLIHLSTKTSLSALYINKVIKPNLITQDLLAVIDKITNTTSIKPRNNKVKIDKEQLNIFHQNLQEKAKELLIIPQLIASKKDLKHYLQKDPIIFNKLHNGWRRNIISLIIY